MKHAKLKIALAAAAVFTVGLAFVGCSGGSGKAQYDHVVTFDYNVGTLGAPIANQYLGVKDGSPIALKPGDLPDSFALGKVTGYEFDGWYLPEGFDENGEPLRDEEDGRVILGREWNFRSKVTEDITLYASFVVKVQLSIQGIAVAEDGTMFPVPLDNQSDWDGWEDLNAPVGSSFTRPIADYTPKSTGYTFVEYYKDAELTEVFDWENYVIEADDTVYARFRVGNWALNVTTAAEFKDAITSNKSISLAADINFTGVSWTSNTIPYTGVIEGNNHTVSHIAYEGEGTQSVSFFALFGTIGAGFKAMDVAFEDVNITFTACWERDFTVSGFASQIHEEAVFENFSFSATVTLAKRENCQKAYIEKHNVSPDAPSELEQYFSVRFIEQY